MTPTPRERARRAFLEMPDDPSEADFMEVVTAAVQAERNAGDLRREEGQAALTAALEDLARVKQQAHDNHIGTGHASAALNRVLLHVTGCSAGEYDTYMETAERIIERLKDDAEHLKQTSQAFVQTTNEMMAAQAELAKVKQERDGLAEQIACILCVFPSVGPLIGLSKDYEQILAAHDRAVAARVLRELAPQINEYDGKALLHEAALYEAGEKEVPGE